jgi:hypothetical protein
MSVMNTLQGLRRVLWRGAWLFSACLLLLAALLLPRVAQAQLPASPGGPVLVITDSSANFSNFYAEILRTEGLNYFATAGVSAIDGPTLAAYDVVVLANVALTDTQAATLTAWVNGGGNLIAMAPDARLASLLGITPTGGQLSNGYLLVNTTQSPGAGIFAQSMQFHGSSALYTLNGATALATLYSGANLPTIHPAITLRTVGAGKAAAFAFDLATSIVYTRQGNPAWATQERDGFLPIRSGDKFFGNATNDPQPDWIDLTKVAVPQADEQQRLLANLVLHMNQAKKPLPRFWYFPKGKRAVVVMTGDDHGNNGTAGRFDDFKNKSPVGCSVADWECVRGTSYIFSSTPLSDAQAAAYTADGFEISLHVNTGCADYTATSLNANYAQQLAEFQTKYFSIPSPVTQRHHCIAWSDWVTGAVVQRAYGMRFDTNYYFWPPAWVNNVPGTFTGSAMPMRFSGLDGTLIDVYNAATQMTDESGQSYPFTVNTLLDRALGPEGFYGAFVINAHTDLATIVESDATVASAQARGVPVVSSKQMLIWLDARGNSSFGGMVWNGTALSFNISVAANANGLQAMLPMRSTAGVLGSLTRAGSPVPFTVAAIKGVDYAFYAAAAGAYVATYAADAVAPTVLSFAPASGATGVATVATVNITFNEDMSPSSINGSSVELRNAANQLVTANVSYDAATRVATLKPTAALIGGATYTATVRGGAVGVRATDLAGNALAASTVWSFETSSANTCPCTAWNNTTLPGTASVNDPGPLEIGVKFTSDSSGYISGIRFYKGASNTGTHVGNLWTSSGQLLASATFTNETATGWQQVDFSTPVAISANTVYVASYFAPNGNYAADGQFFASNGVDNGNIHLLRDGVSGGNGVYAYSSASSFPASSFNATNYWVDVVFTFTGPADTTPPTVLSTSPANGAVNVAIAGALVATFSEPLDPATVSSATFELRHQSTNALVAANVSYTAGTTVVTAAPQAALAANTAYTLTVRGGGADPRVKDSAGNALVANVTSAFTTGAGDVCLAPANAIVAENCQPGSLASEWDISGSGDLTIQGFATQISVNRGQTVSFKVSTTASNYRFDIYRMGYYGGLGARKVATVTPSATLPQAQPACLNDVSTGLIDCGNWAVSGSWTVPSTATSGIYFAKLVRADNGGASHIVFVVRDDASTADLVFQTSDTTWQAYNDYGGNSLYVGAPAGRAYKVSYNRPFNTRNVDGGQDWVFNAEYPMVRWLEANGYSMSYQSGVDTDRSGGSLLNKKVFVSVGHDEYWSAAQRSNVEAARGAGVNLAFFSGNEIFWKIRWENSVDGSSTPYRTLVSYKETKANAKIDPTPAWTGTWRDPRFSPPSDGGKPENALTGTSFLVNGGTTAIVVPEAEGKLRLWRNTSVASLSPGASATLTNSSLGYEWDADVDNGSRPPGLIRLSSTTATNVEVLQDFGSTYAFGTANHALTLYKHASGARVFGAGTIQWSWGLDAAHDRAGPPADIRMQQATVNLLADMNAQPASLRSGLVPATASTDVVAPTAQITAPAANANVFMGLPMVITGTASDSGGGLVGGIEVSTDNGATWHPATGRASWSYSWTPTALGSATLRVRAVDDSGNLQASPTTVSVTVQPRACPCTIWPNTATPAILSDSDTGAVNLGLKFTATQDGYVTALRFYKSATNTGTHVGTLWSSTGAQLASVTFTNETASGWQQMALPQPVFVTAGTVYVVSYLAPVGRYSADSQFFATSGVDSTPLKALAEGVSGSNGVYAYAATTTFPTQSFRSTNYWVDVVFDTTAPPDTTPPTVTSRTPAAGATLMPLSTVVAVTFSEPMDAATLNTTTLVLRDTAGALVPATVAYNPTTRVATLTPSSPLAGNTTYTATVLGGSTDPRVKDLAGNALVANNVGSFTTLVPDTTPPLVTAVSPLAGATGVAGTGNLTVTFNEAMDAASISAASFVLRDSANALVPAVVSYNATTRVATLNPTPTLSSAATYTATVLGGGTDPRVKDAAGNALAADSTWSFTVADTTGPTVISRLPAANATAVALTATPTVTFSEAMNAATINASTVILRVGANAPLAATVDYNASTRTATLTPSSPLLDSTVYTLTVLGGTTDPRVKDAAGNALAASSSANFTALDTTPPTVTATVPSNAAVNVVGSANLSATFSEAMNPASITAASFVLRDAANVVVPATVTYNTTTRVATLNPLPTLVSSASYTATVVGGSGGVQDVSGNVLAASNSWTFTVADTVRPTVVARTPAANATGVALNAVVTVTFSEAMNAATINTSTLTLRVGAGAPIAAIVSYDSLTRVATLTPISPLSGSTVYTLRVLGGTLDPSVKDVAGNALSITSSANFTTIDTTPPTLTSSAPANAAIGFGRTANLSVTFNEAMLAASVNTTSIELRDTLTNALVPCVVTLNGARTVATINPNATLSALTSYTLTVKGGGVDPRVKDNIGNAMAATQTIIFSTGP